MFVRTMHANLHRPQGSPRLPTPRDTVELSSVPAPPAEPTVQARAGRPFLSLYFSCANAYARAYRSADGICYDGRCPRCGKSITFPIGEGGTTRRMFEVRCD